MAFSSSDPRPKVTATSSAADLPSALPSSPRRPLSTACPCEDTSDPQTPPMLQNNVCQLASAGDVATGTGGTGNSTVLRSACKRDSHSARTTAAACADTNDGANSRGRVSNCAAGAAGCGGGRATSASSTSYAQATPPRAHLDDSKMDLTITEKSLQRTHSGCLGASAANRIRSSHQAGRSCDGKSHQRWSSNSTAAARGTASGGITDCGDRSPTYMSASWTKARYSSSSSRSTECGMCSTAGWGPRDSNWSSCGQRTKPPRPRIASSGAP
mmetsp:Transcript_73644/g.204737  ORF Transcript_73644/g.204737 Transcript_73644/m.204737 type:complete len:271 (-) Transcript_73644:458-1270(-)